MSKTITYKTSAGSIIVERGTEGPRHDPYSYDHYTIIRKGKRKAELHIGLGTWSRIGGRLRTRWTPGVGADRDRAEVERFEQACGYTLAEIIRAIDEAEYRRDLRCYREYGMSQSDLYRAECSGFGYWPGEDN